jgi:hypothetical protein
LRGWGNFDLREGFLNHPVGERKKKKNNKITALTLLGQKLCAFASWNKFDTLIVLFYKMFYVKIIPGLKMLLTSMEENL